MITLYELHWSHYCEKVRLALNFMGLPWRVVEIDAFRKSELRGYSIPAHLPNPTVPAIHDDLTGAFVMDSTPILRYLSQTYSSSPQLFPGEADARAKIDAKLLDLDSCVGLAGRRFAYTQVILECPGLLPTLFLKHRARGLFTKWGVRRVTAWFLAVLLTKRFEFHRSERLGLYESLEAYLLGLAAHVETHDHVVSNRFSAADLALAAYLRPLTIVPFYADNPKLQGLFRWGQGVLAQWSGEGKAAYQVAIEQARSRRPPWRRRILPRGAGLPFKAGETSAANDQRPVWDLGLLAAPWHWRSLWQNKVRAPTATEWCR